MTMPLFRLADRLLNTPLLIHPAKAEVILAVVAGRIGVAADLADPLSEAAFHGAERLDPSGIASRRVPDGVAVIPILDTLVNRGAWLDSQSGLTSYDGIAAQVRDAAADPAVGAILLDIASPGGEAAGMAGLADLIRSVRETKPVTAVVNDMAASAAYGLASAASEIVISPTSLVGSIGVVMLHTDHSEELAAQGVKPTLIFAGSHKVDGNPFEPLSEAVRSDLQQSVDAHYRQFLDLVAMGRGARLTAEMARATGARTFMGIEAIRVGLADRIASFDEVLTSLSSTTQSPTSRPSGRIARKGGHLMISDELEVTAEAPALAERENVAAAAPATTTAAVFAEQARTDTQRVSEAVTSARLEERARIRLIVNAPEAEGRSRQALMLATETALGVAEAQKILGASPKETRIDALAERATSGEGFGSSRDIAPGAPKAQTEEGWKRAVANANRRFVRA